MNDHRHLQDEVLSAHLDRQLGGAERAGAERHLATCDRCEARLAALGGARELLALDPGAPLDEVSRRRLVDRAAAGSADARRPAPGTPRRQWWRNPGVLAAAAVAALALGIGVVALGGDDSGDQLAGGISPDVYAGHVGDLDDPHAIRSLLSEFSTTADESGERLLRAPAAGSGESTEGGAPTGGTEGADSGAARSQGGGGAGAPAVDAAPTAGADAIREDSEAPALPPGVGLEHAARCLAETSPPEGSRLVLAATGRFQGTDAIVLAFRTGDSPRVLALVLARADCTILSAQSIAA